MAGYGALAIMLGGLAFWPVSLALGRRSRLLRWLFVAQLAYLLLLIGVNAAFGERDLFDNPGWLIVLNFYSLGIGALFLAASLVALVACILGTSRKPTKQGDVSVT